MNSTRSIPFAKPWITDEEREAVLEVLKGDVLTHGPQGHRFEEEFAKFLGGEAYCVSLSSGMAALHLAYFQMGLAEGDEVIVPSQTHIATVHAVEIMGARPIFVDCESKTGNINPALIEERIGPQTKAVSLVHFLGVPCDMDAIMDIASRHKLKVIEDCAISLGARYKGKHIGLFGDGACFSFYPVKHITTGDGGMFVTRHKDVAEQVAKARGFGVDRTFAERTIPGMYDVPTLGLNYRLSDINAAIGRCQLRRIDENLRRRRLNFMTLQNIASTLKDVQILGAPENNTVHSHYCLSIVFQGQLKNSRDEIALRLKESGVGTSVYYPQPVPRMSYYRKKYGYDKTRYPHAEFISDRSIALPVGPHLTKEDMIFIGEALKKIIREITQ